MKAWFQIVALLSMTIMQGLFVASVFSIALNTMPESYWMVLSFIAGVVSFIIIIPIVFYMGFYAAKNEDNE